MYLLYNDSGIITSIDSHKPGPIFKWIYIDPVPSDVQEQYWVVDGVLEKRPVPLVIEYPYAISRIIEYDIATQLELIVDDINDGVFGEAAKNGRFIAYIKNIKAKYPKK
jgi:hypothetical protein